MLYMDGANLNALLGITRPGDSGFDIMHFNMHKTFSTPHGGGGPGAGALGMKANLEPFMPSPVIAKKEDQKGNTVYYLDYKRPLSIGPVHGFYGNIANLIRAYCYIRQHGGPGLREVSEAAIINAMYLREKLRQRYDLPYTGRSLHEFVLSGKQAEGAGCKNRRYRQENSGFRNSFSNSLFPADCARSDDDRANRIREQGLAR